MTVTPHCTTSRSHLNKIWKQDKQNANPFCRMVSILKFKHEWDRDCLSHKTIEPKKNLKTNHENLTKSCKEEEKGLELVVV